MNLNIRVARIQDLENIGRLYDRVTTALEQGTNFPGWKKGVYPCTKTAEIALQKNSLYCTLFDDQIAGSFVLSQTVELAYEQISWSFPSDYSKIMVVHTFVVDPAFSGKGIGKQQLSFIINHATSLGLHSIRLDTYEKNLPAIRLYESCGFQFMGKIDLGRGEQGLHWYNGYEKILI